MHRFTRLTFILTCLVLNGCQSTARMDADNSPAPSTERNDDPEYLGPRVAVATDGAQDSAPPIETIAAIPEAAPAKIEDGRPEWWYEGVREDNGRRSVCAETLARDLPDARRQAVLIARNIAEKLLGASDDASRTSERILRTSVAPLTAVKGGEYRYVVYVEVSRPRMP